MNMSPPSSISVFYTKVTNMCLYMGSCRILQILNLAKCRSGKRKFFVFFKGKHSFNPFKSTLEVIKKMSNFAQSEILARNFKFKFLKKFVVFVVDLP